jgi:hypothetical protein
MFEFASSEGCWFNFYIDLLGVFPNPPAILGPGLSAATFFKPPIDT